MGTLDYDKLFLVWPLLDKVGAACKAHYHPKRKLTTDERMVATKTKTGMTQYMKQKPTKWGIKLFVLANSSSVYTVDFKVHVRKSHIISVHGLSYDCHKSSKAGLPWFWVPYLHGQPLHQQ